MARAPVAKKSRLNESRSSSTIASSAKAKKKTADSLDADWAQHDQDAAAVQGWGLFECIDMDKPRKVFYEVQEWGVRFENASFARAFVLKQSNSGDALATKAIRLVFRSKAGFSGKKK